MEDDLSQREKKITLEREFLDIAAHQMQAPLAYLKKQIDSLLSDRTEKLSVQQIEAINKISRTNEDSIALISNLLAVAKIEGGKLKLNKKKINPVVLVRKVMRQYEGSVTERGGIMFFSQSKGKMPKVLLDEILFAQVVDNLISNAIKYNSTDTRISVNVKATEESLIVSVNNRGPAIPRKVQVKLFSKFERTDTKVSKQTPGTGLGLYISEQIVDLHGGRIKLESNDEKGTTFYIEIPIE
jgi:two-component system, OmpR family, sensor histidine kinase VicK